MVMLYESRVNRANILKFLDRLEKSGGYSAGEIKRKPHSDEIIVTVQFDTNKKVNRSFNITFWDKDVMGNFRTGGFKLPASDYSNEAFDMKDLNDYIRDKCLDVMY